MTGKLISRLVVGINSSPLRLFRYPLSIGLVALIPIQAVFSVDLSIEPGISMRELYTDNISLARPGQEQSAFVTEITPSVQIRARGARNTVDANLRVENLIFHGVASDPRVFVQGQYNSRSRLWGNSLFMDLRGTHAQANNQNRGRVAADNISRTGNRVNVSTFTVSPFWKIQLAGFAEGEARFNYSEVYVDEDATLSDSKIHEENIRLASARRFDLLGWAFKFKNRRESRKDSGVDDIRFFNTSGELSYRFLPRFTAFVRGGYADNDLGKFQLNSENGAFYQVGGRWQPTNRFKLSAAVGNNSFARIAFSPFVRSKLEIGFRHNTVGLNTGSQWDSMFQLNLFNTIMTAEYQTDTVSTQQVLLENDVFDTRGNSVGVDTGLAVNSNVDDLSALQNEVYERKRGQLSLQRTFGKSTLRFSGYLEKRNFQGLRQQEDAKGALLAWRMRFDGSTSSVVTADVEHINGGNTALVDAQSNTRWSIEAQLRRAIMRSLTGTVGYRYTVQDASLSDSEYEENRVYARINYLYR